MSKIWYYPQQVRVARFTSTYKRETPMSKIWYYPQQVRVARFTSTYKRERHQCLKSGTIPNKWGWPDSPQPIRERDTNMFKIWHYPQQVRVARFTSTYKRERHQCLKSGTIPNKWGWPDSPQPIRERDTNMFKIWHYPQQVRVARFTSTYKRERHDFFKSGTIPNKWGWPDSPQPIRERDTNV